MNWLKKIWILRKQQDAVKMVFVFGILFVVFCSQIVYEGVQLYKKQCAPSEYVLNSTETVSGMAMERIRAQQFVSRVSFQQQMEVTFSGAWGTKSMQVYQVSEDYFKESYGCENDSGMQTYYLNATAWKALDTAMRATGSGLTDVTEAQIMIQNQDWITDSGNDPIADGMQQKESFSTVRIRKIPVSSKNQWLPGICSDDAWVFCTGSSSELSGASAMRVLLKKHDTAGEVKKAVTGLGLVVEEGKEELAEQNAEEQSWLKLRYEAVLALICLAAAVCILRYGVCGT